MNSSEQLSTCVVTDISLAVAREILRPRLAVARARATSLRQAHVPKNSAQALFFCHVPPPGFEPGIAVPKTAVISISPRERLPYHTTYSLMRHE